MSLFDERSKPSSKDNLPIDGGMFPINILCERLRLRSERDPLIASGICPVKLLLDRSKTDIVTISFSYLFCNPLTVNTIEYYGRLLEDSPMYCGLPTSDSFILYIAAKFLIYLLGNLPQKLLLERSIICSIENGCLPLLS